MGDEGWLRNEIPDAQGFAPRAAARWAEGTCLFALLIAG